jgi:hypothetical protein
MEDPQRQELMLALREHERQIERLSRRLEALEPVAALAATAQLTRHRINIALLASKLASSASAAPPGGAPTPTRWWRAVSTRCRTSRD